MKKIFLIFIFIVFSFSKTLVVDNNPSCIPFIGCYSCEASFFPDNPYTSIQDAVNHANNGDIIKICKGDYNEKVTISNKKNLTILNGKNAKKPSDINWHNNNYVLKLNGSNVKNITLENIYLHGTGSKNTLILYKGENLTLKNVIIKSDKKKGIYGGRNFKGKLNFENVEINATDEMGAYFKNCGDVDFSDVNVTSYKNGLDLSCSGDYNLKNINIDSQDKNGLKIRLGKDIYCYGLNITSKDTSILIEDNVNGNYIFKDLNLTSKNSNGIHILNGKDINITNADIISYKSSIYIDEDTDGNYYFKKLDLNSSSRNGIRIVKGKNVTLFDSNITADQKAVYIQNKVNGDYNLTNLMLKSISNDTIKIDNAKKVDIEKSCIYKESDENDIYGLDLRSDNSDSSNPIKLKNNCFYGTPIKTLAKAKYQNHVDPNYWYELSGVYNYNNIIDNSPLNSCPNNCKYIPKPVGNWRMDECKWNGTDGEVKDSSDNGNNGTAKNGATTSDTAVLCRAGVFNGNNYVDIPKSSTLTLKNQLTYMAWIKLKDPNQVTNRDKLENIFTNQSWANALRFTEKGYYKGGQKILFQLKIGGNVKYLYSDTKITDTKWHFIAATYDGNYMHIYIDGKEDTNLSVSGKIDTNSADNIIAAEYGNYYFKGWIDELKVFNQALSKKIINEIYNNEKKGENYDGSNRTCPICNETQQNYSFNAVSKIIYNNSIQDWDNNLTTQILNKPFDLYILSKNKDTNTPQEANITKVRFDFYSNGDEKQCSGSPYANEIICDDSTTNKCPDTNLSGEVEIKNTKINQAVKCAEVYIEGKELNFKGGIVQEANSSDNFAIRPQNFAITNIPSKIKAGSEFNLTIQALDYDSNPSKDYNESLSMRGSSPELNWTENNINCITGDLEEKDGGNFKNGETNITLNYNEVGDLNITIKEIEGSEFAKIDEDDTPNNQLFITPITKTIAIVPHHFEVDVNVSNFDNNFTYLDNNLSIYSLIDLNITAQNEQNQTTKNYNTKCYAKNVDVNLTPDIFRHNETLLKNVLYKIFYVDSNTTVYKNSDINFSIGEGNFTTDHNGSALVKIHLNFERNISNPEDPFEYNITDAEVNDSDIKLTYLNSDGNATFYYGNIYMIDMITSKNDFNISQKILMFDDNSSDTYKPNSDEILLNWYQNLFNHLKDANISNFVVTKGYVYNPSDIINSIKVKVNDINDSINLNIQRTNSNINFAVIHIIDTNASHLWYSKYGNEYNISQGSSCTNHFCFTITWPKNEQNSGVLSGDVNGTKAEVNESNETKRGVKIFR